VFLLSLSSSSSQVLKTLLIFAGQSNELVVKDSCFLNNEVFNFGILTSASTEEEFSNNFVDPIDPDLRCEFFSRVGFVFGSITSIECIDFDATECALFVPTSAPSAAPTISPAPTRGGGFNICFSGHNEVEIKGKGRVEMKNLRIGDMVLVGDNKYESVYSFGHLDDHDESEYLQIYTGSSSPTHRRPLEISSDHMVFVEGHHSVPASRVEIGDKLILGSDPHTLVEVVAIKSIVRRGSYAPFTKSGTIVVNDILASSFVAFQDEEYLHIGGYATPLSFQWLAHTFEAPHRMICALGFCGETYTPEGVSHWVHVPLEVSQWMLRQHLVVLCLVFVPVLAFFGVLALLEATVFCFPATFLSSLLLAVGFGFVFLNNNNNNNNKRMFAINVEWKRQANKGL